MAARAPMPTTTGKRPWPLAATTLSVTSAATSTTTKRKTTTKRSTATTKKPTTKKHETTLATATTRRPKLIWRTRDQENSLLYNLQLDVASLQSELQTMRAYRNMLMNRAVNRPDDLDGSFARTVREYFRVFRHGYTPLGPGRRAPPLALMSGEHGVAAPDEFVRRVMDEHVSIGRFTGLEQMMKQWERYSSVLGPITLDFMDSEILTTFRGASEGAGQVLVTSRARYHLYISRRTIEIMFPHVLQHRAIVDRILGRHISGVGKFDFVFELATGRIIRYEFSLDLTASFIDLLGDPAMVAMLLNDALISDEFFIGDLSEFVPERDSPTSDSSGPAESKMEEEKDERVAMPVRPWKMTISSILSSVDDDEDDALGEADGDVTMQDENEPQAEQNPDDDVFHRHVHVRFEPV